MRHAAAVKLWVLERWAAGETAFAIAHRMALQPAQVLRIIQTARVNGDVRAAPHGPGPKSAK